MKEILRLTQIRYETDSIASISEEQTASTEEMLATTEEQNVSIDNIYTFMKQIERASNNLSSDFNS